MRNIFWWLPFGRVPEISANDLHRSLSTDPAPQIIDVRSPREWQTNRIHGAVNVPITSFHRGIKAVPLDAERPIVAICLSAHRSIPAVRALRELGFTDVCQLQGGMQEWWKAGLPVIEDRP